MHPFSKFACAEITVADPDPVFRIEAAVDARLERGVWPFRRRGDEPVLDRIEMDVIHVRRVVLVVAVGVLPASVARVARMQRSAIRGKPAEESPRIPFHFMRATSRNGEITR